MDSIHESRKACREIRERRIWRQQSIHQEFTHDRHAVSNKGDAIMKRKFNIIMLCLGCWAVATVRAAETNTAAGRVGVYDSRVVAYAWFCSDAQMAKLNEEMATAKAAKQAGDDVKLKELSAALKAKQDQMHREVFSTAPADEALAVLQGRIQEIEQAAGIARLVSKWDLPALAQFKDAEKVDVTDALVREFLKPTEKQLKVIEGIKKAEPVPLEKCDELLREGKI
jgi:hypothetical protein